MKTFLANFSYSELLFLFNVAFVIAMKLTLKDTTSVNAYTVLWQVCCVCLSPIYFLIPQDPSPVMGTFQSQDLLFAGISIGGWLICDIFAFRAYRYEEVSNINLIFPLFYVISAIIQVMILKTAYTHFQVIGLLLVMAVSIVAVSHKKQLGYSKGLLYALITSLGEGIGVGFSSKLLSIPLPIFMIAAFLFPAIVNLFFVLRPTMEQIVSEWRRGWWQILLCAVLYTLNYWLYLKACSYGDLLSVTIIYSLSIAAIAIAAIHFLKEKERMRTKIICAIIAMAGVILCQLPLVLK